ncbi:hypothetical protein GCM10009558_016940 [Virgisporangium aurantiacum]
MLTMARATTGKFIEIGATFEAGTRRLTRTEVIRENAPSSVADVSYTYDDAGNTTRIADTPAGGAADVQCFTTDHLRRMTAAWTPTSGDCKAAPTVGGLGGAAPYWQSWSYDKVGNRTGQVDHRATGDVTTTYATPAAGTGKPHAVTGRTAATNGVATTTGYTYDNAGNMTTRPVASGQQTLEWDAEGLLTGVTDPAGRTSYLYDADGNRLIRRDPTGTTLYLPGMELRLAANSVTCTRFYTFAGSTIAQRSATAVTWLVPDHQGTANIAVDTSDKQAVSRRRQLPFGEPRGAPQPWANERGFVGGTADPTGTVHLGAREYDPGIGRFTSVDPVLDPADPQQMHGYAYANNSPISYSDSNGMRACGPDGVLCGYAGYNKSLGTPQQYQRERFTFRVLEPLRRHLATIKKKLSGVTTRKLKNGSTFTTVNDGHKVSYFVNEIELEPNEIPDPYDFAVQYDEAYAASNAEDSVLRSLRAMSMACLKSKRGCSTALHSALGAATGAYISRTFYDCGEVCQAYTNGILMTAVMGAGRFAAVRIPALKNLTCMVNSFDPDTPVLMADGTTRPIKDVRTGDGVLAADPETGETGYRPVVATIVGTGDKHLVRLTIDTDGDRGDATGTIVATDKHPFWLPQPGRWVDAGEIVAGQALQTASGATVRVTANEAWTASTRVVNLTVADIHTYYAVAGDTPILVHNNGPFCGTPFGRKTPGGRPFHGTDYSLDEMVQFAYGHSGAGNPAMGRPSLGQIETTLRNAGPVRIGNQNAASFDYKGVRVIVNYDLPWKSTTYFTGGN